MKPDMSIISVLADILGLDPKSKDINTKILSRLKTDKTIPNELKRSAMSVILPTTSESKQMNFKEFRQKLKEHTSSSTSSMDTIRQGYGYTKVDQSVHFDNDGYEVDDETWEGIEDDIDDLTFDDLVKFGAYDPNELIITDDYGNEVDDLDDIDPEQFQAHLDQQKKEDAALYAANESINYNLNEALSLLGRLKLGQAMKRHSGMMTKKRQLMMHRSSSPEQLMRRAHHAANALFYSKILKGRDINTLTNSEKSRMEVLRAKSVSKIAKMVPKLLNVVKQKERLRLKSSAV